MARDPRDPGTLDLLSPLRRGGRPLSTRKPKSDRQRADDYRARLRDRGGARITLNPDRADALRRVLIVSLGSPQLSDSDRRHLFSVLHSLPGATLSATPNGHN